MKKKLITEIKHLANQLLSESGLDNTTELKHQLAYLYERVSILEYLESLLDDVPKKDSKSNESESLDSKSYREKNWFKEPEPVPPSNFKDSLAEPVIEKIKDLVAEIPEDAQKIEDLLREVLPKKKYYKNDLEDFASDYKTPPVFERKESSKTNDAVQTNTVSDTKSKSLNDKLGKEIVIGLNDRLAFIKHLFNGNAGEYESVLSQINTLSSVDEVAYFIKVKVKPEYNYWLNKEEYESRFMALIERKFL